MAEVFAIDKVLDMSKNGILLQINICIDSLTFLESLERSLFSLLPIVLGKLNQMVVDLIYKITKINSIEHKVRFSWCLAHIGIIHNERVNVLEVKKASIGGESCDNSITNRELISSLQGEYANIDNPFGSGKDRALVSGYYLNNFLEI